MQELILLGSKDRASVNHKLVMEHWGPSLEWALLRTSFLFRPLIFCSNIKMTNLSKDDLSLPLITTIKVIKAHWAGQPDSTPPLEPFPCLGILSHVSLIKLPFILLAPCCSFLILGHETTTWKLFPSSPS